MANIINFYMDDSGTRHPDRKPGKRAAHGNDWFALGGILVKQEDEPLARSLHQTFCDDWGIDYPIHSVEIRGTNEGFSWLKDLEKADAAEFLEDLWRLRILDLDPMLSTAGTVSGAEPLRYDAFAAEPAGMLEDFGAVAVEMLVQDQAVVWASQEASEPMLAVLYHRDQECLVARQSFRR